MNDEMFDELLDILIEHGALTEKELLPTREATHGTCCTCQDCGHWHDDCVCLHNELLQKITDLRDKYGKKALG